MSKQKISFFSGRMTDLENEKSDTEIDNTSTYVRNLCIVAMILALILR